MSILFGPNNPMMAEYAQRNPNSVMARMYQAKYPTTGSNIPSFAAGGMMGPQGAPIRPGMGMQPSPSMNEPQLGASAPAPMSPQQIEQEAQRIVRAQPQVAEQVRSMVMGALQSGELTYDELNMTVQLAKTALANPASYPQVREFAIKNGLGSEADIPQELDKGLLLMLIIIGKTMESAGGKGGQAGAGPIGMAQDNLGKSDAGLLPEYKEGGMTGDKKHVAVVHAREYIVPEDALIYHGKKTFDRMIEQAREPKDGSQA